MALNATIPPPPPLMVCVSHLVPSWKNCHFGMACHRWVGGEFSYGLAMTRWPTSAIYLPSFQAKSIH